MRSLKLGKKILYILTIIGAITLLFSCVLYFTGIKSYPILGILSIGTPVVLLINLLLSIYWLLLRHKVFILSATSVVISLLVFGPIYQLPSVEEHMMKEDLRIMSFNSRGFNKLNQIKQPDLDTRILEMVNSYEPDIVCFQEFDYTRAAELKAYPHQYVNYIFTEEAKVVQAILSKYPLVEKGVVNFPGSANNVIFADIKLENEVVRVYNVHLQSFRITPSVEDITSESREQFFSRVSRTFFKQQEQAEILKEHQRATNLRTIICADLNNTAFSNIYKEVKGKLNDSFEEAGSGLGTTFHFLGYPLRIDFIFSDPDFEVINHEIHDEKLSDHYPILASIQLHTN